MFLKNQPRFYMVNRLYGNEGENKVFPGGSDSKESACNVEDLALISGSGGYSGEGNGYPLQYSCLENSMARGTWWASVHGVAKSQTPQTD